jgi:hypothetical protein
MSDKSLLAAWAVVLTMLAVVITLSYTTNHPSRVVPQCAEDQVLVGTGDFEDGRWQAYWCGPAVDDYRGGR